MLETDSARPSRLRRERPRQTLSCEMMANFFEKYYWVYVLESLKNGKKYTGYTKDLPSRFEAHQNGEVQATKNRRPFKLIYFEGCLNQKDALKREKYLIAEILDVAEKVGQEIYRKVWELMNCLPMFKDCQTGDLSNAEWLADRVVNIPSSVI